MLKKLMKELGVNFGQKFSIGGMNTYEFTKDGLISKDGYNDLILREMICGKITKKDIQLEPWKPEYGDIYYTIDFMHDRVHEISWSDHTIDNNLYEAGLVCKTEEEAEKLKAYIPNQIRIFRKCNIYSKFKWR